MRIALEFDGVIVTDDYPGIGKKIPLAFEVLNKLQKDNHLLILWTTRRGKYLREAISFCKKNGLNFYSVNKNYPEEDVGFNNKKINADVFIEKQKLITHKTWAEIFWMLKFTTEG